MDINIVFVVVVVVVFVVVGGGGGGGGGGGVVVIARNNCKSLKSPSKIDTSAQDLFVWSMEET